MRRLPQDPLRTRFSIDTRDSREGNPGRILSALDVPRHDGQQAMAALVGGTVAAEPNCACVAELAAASVAVASAAPPSLDTEPGVTPKTPAINAMTPCPFWKV